MSNLDQVREHKQVIDAGYQPSQLRVRRGIDLFQNPGTSGTVERTLQLGAAETALEHLLLTRVAGGDAAGGTDLKPTAGAAGLSTDGMNVVVSWTNPAPSTGFTQVGIGVHPPGRMWWTQDFAAR